MAWSKKDTALTIATGGMYAPAKLGYDAFNKAAPGGQLQSAPGIDPELKGMAAAQKEKAKSFRSNLKNMQSEEAQNIQTQARAGLARDLAGVQKSYGTRNLLYSGLKSEADVGAQQSAASESARRQLESRQNLESQADAYDQAALSSGLAIQQIEQQRADQEFQRKAAEQESKKQVTGSLLGGIGSAIGGLFGRR